MVGGRCNGEAECDDSTDEQDCICPEADDQNCREECAGFPVPKAMECPDLLDACACPDPNAARMTNARLVKAADVFKNASRVRGEPVNDPQCGTDGVDYGSPCEANCARPILPTRVLALWTSTVSPQTNIANSSVVVSTTQPKTRAVMSHPVTVAVDPALTEKRAAVTGHVLRIIFSAIAPTTAKTDVMSSGVLRAPHKKRTPSVANNVTA